MEKKIRLSRLSTQTRKENKVNEDELIDDVRRYLQYTKRYSSITIRNTMPRVERIVRHYKVAKPTPKDAMRIEEEQRRLGNNDSTIVHYLKALKLMAEYHGEKLEIRLPKPIKREHLQLSPPECQALLDSCLNLRDKCLIALLLYTGLRNNEICSLRASSDIDVKNGYVFVNDHGQGIKSRVERRAVMPKGCTQIMEQYPSFRESLGIETDFLFFAETGRPLSAHRLQIIVKEVAKRSKIGKRVTPHGLRHACAALMLKYAKVPITEVSLQLGHKDVSTTVDWYLRGDYQNLKTNFEQFRI